MWKIFGKARGEKPRANSEMGWNTGGPEVMSTEAKQSQIQFPESWVGRVQTPVKRVPAGKMWSQPAWSVPDTWGGPKRG